MSVESTAALNICRKFDGLWPCFYAFILVPPFIRNALYRLFAKQRYRLFGKKVNAYCLRLLNVKDFFPDRKYSPLREQYNRRGQKPALNETIPALNRKHRLKSIFQTVLLLFIDLTLSSPFCKARSINVKTSTEGAVMTCRWMPPVRADK